MAHAKNCAGYSSCANIAQPANGSLKQALKLQVAQAEKLTSLQANKLTS